MRPQGQPGTTERGSLIKRAREPAVDASGQQNVYGAGKTTTIRILSTLLRPDAGAAARAGARIERFSLHEPDRDD